MKPAGSVCAAQPSAQLQSQQRQRQQPESPSPQRDQTPGAIPALTPVAGVSVPALGALTDSPEALPVTAAPANGALAADAGGIVAAADAASPAAGDLRPDTEDPCGEGGPFQLKLVFDGMPYWLHTTAVDGLALPDAVAGACLPSSCEESNLRNRRDTLTHVRHELLNAT